MTPARGPRAQRRRQRRRESRATTIAPREEATAPTATRRERSPPIMLHRAKGEIRRRGEAAAERHACVSATARQRWHEDRERGAAGSGAVRAARRRLPKETTQPHHAKGESRRRGAATAERHAAVSAVARASGSEDRERGAAGSGAVRAARPRRPSERTRLHRQPHAESTRCRLLVRSEQPPRSGGGRVSRRRERDGTMSATPP